MPSPSDFTASSSERFVAYIIDVFAVSTAYIFLIGLSEASGLRLDEPALYPALLFLYSVASLLKTKGSTPGKYVRNIIVVSESGRPIDPSQAVLRSMFFALPYALMSSGRVDLGFVAPGFGANIALLGVFYLLAEVLALHNSINRRSLADRVCRTLVVRLPPLQPHKAPAVPMFSANDAEFGNPPKRPPPN